MIKGPKNLLEKITTEEITGLTKISRITYSELSRILASNHIDHFIPTRVHMQQWELADQISDKILPEMSDKMSLIYFRDECILIDHCFFPDLTQVFLNRKMPFPDEINEGMLYYFAYHKISKYSSFNEHPLKEKFVRKNDSLVERTRLGEWIK